MLSFRTSLIALALVSLSGAPGLSANEIERPLYARPATTTASFNMDAYFEYFDGLALQEAVDLEGWTAGLDFTYPFSRSMQLRFLLPVRTEAEGVLVDGGEDVDIDGWGGTFRYASLHFEHQLVGVDGGPNRLSYALGLGHRTAILETSVGDKYNHRGRSLHTALRYDRVLGSGAALLADLEVRFYEESDDLNPGNLRDDSFFLVKFAGGWVGSRRGALTPGLELTADLVEDYF
ncbi:MAG: hypothetical protein EP301_03960, partial [Gammaproteobacteria bacterium]